MTLKVPRLRTLTFLTAIIQRYQKRGISVEEALVEMYMAGVSVRRVEDVTEALWGSLVSAGTVSELNNQVYGRKRQTLITTLHASGALIGISLATWFSLPIVTATVKVSHGRLKR